MESDPLDPGHLEICSMPVADLAIGYSPRRATIDSAHADALIEVVDRLPPIVVDEATGAVIDGVHRLEAFKRAGRKEIPALLFKGDSTASIALAVHANVMHGKPLDRSEREAAAVVLLRRCPERSDRWLGETCGLSHATVGRLRREVAPGGGPVRTGRDGRRRPVDPGPGRAAVAKVLSEGAHGTVREVADAAGVAPSTVAKAAASLGGAAADDRPAPAMAPARTARAAKTAPVAITEDPAFSSSPRRRDTAAWLARTAVQLGDLDDHLSDVPLSRIYELADECRRRARVWADMANALEGRPRGTVARITRLPLAT
jgi:ParB-like chromosome segregation protein Spo0J